MSPSLAQRFECEIALQFSRKDMNQVDSFDLDRLSGSLQYDEDSVRQEPIASNTNPPPAVVQDKKKTKKEVIGLKKNDSIDRTNPMFRRRISNARNDNAKKKRRKRVNNSRTRVSSIVLNQPNEFWLFYQRRNRMLASSLWIKRKNMFLCMSVRSASREKVS